MERNMYCILKPYLDKLIERIEKMTPAMQLQLWNEYADSVYEQKVYPMEMLDEFFEGMSASDMISMLDRDFNLSKDYFQMDGLGFYCSFDWEGMNDCQIHDVAVEILTADKHESQYYPYVFFRDLKNDYEKEIRKRDEWEEKNSNLSVKE